MNSEQNNKPKDMERLKEIPKWTRRYAQNRTVPFFVSLMTSTILFGAIGIPSYFGGNAYRAGNMVLFWICISITAVAMISLAFFCVPKWGGKFIERISQRLYGCEGNVSIPEPEAMKKKKWLGYIVGMVFGGCVISSVFLGEKYIPIEYMQPVSALYVVPFLVFLYFWQRPKVSPLMLIWPSLYTIHAILIVVGVPILFTGDSSGLNMFLPTFGYGFLTFVIGHVYSRYALKKLKDITHLEGGDTSCL
jgi:hypothetical protein